MKEIGRKRYEWTIVWIMFFAWGFVFLDRSALSYITPSIVADLNLTNGQVSQITMWQTIGFAIAGPIIGMISDKTGKRKLLLVSSIIATSVFSALSGLAESYEYLVFMRFLVGAAEGPVPAIAITMVIASSAKGNFGKNVGIVNAGVAVIATTLGPTLVTQMITLSNWRWTFALVSVPSLILALVILKFIKEIDTNNHSSDQKIEKAPFWSLFKYRNVNIGIFVSIFCMTGLWIIYSFAPLYLTSVSNISLKKMGLVMSLMGVFQILTVIIVPLFSDHFGRKPGIIAFSVLATLAPIGLYIAPSSWVGLVALIVFGGLFGCIAPIFQNIIPNESLPSTLIATASSVIIAVGEILGSLILGVSGRLSDSYGLPFMMIICASAGLLMAIFGLGYKETNARKSKSRVFNVKVENALQNK